MRFRKESAVRYNKAHQSEWEHASWKEFLRTVLGPASGLEVLDVGAGTGASTIPIAKERGGRFAICHHPCCSLNLLACKFLDSLFYSCELLLQLVSVLFQPFLFLFCRYETAEERTVSTPATAAIPSPSSQRPLASSYLWFTHFLSPPFITHTCTVMVQPLHLHPYKLLSHVAHVFSLQPILHPSQRHLLSSLFLSLILIIS